MSPEGRRARLLKQVTRLREIEHRAAAAAASAALTEASRARQLATRAAALVAGYADLAQVCEAHELAARRFAGDRMRNISAQTGAQAEHAAVAAELRVASERQARRRREAIEEASARLAIEATVVTQYSNDSAGRGLARFLIEEPVNHRGA